MQPQENIEHVFDKLKRLPPERVVEVEDFIDFLHDRNQDRALIRAAQGVSQPVLGRVWDNAEDAAYDAV